LVEIVSIWFAGQKKCPCGNISGGALQSVAKSAILMKFFEKCQFSDERHARPNSDNFLKSVALNSIQICIWVLNKKQDSRLRAVC
jgi:hypothetical protein